MVDVFILPVRFGLTQALGSIQQLMASRMHSKDPSSVLPLEMCTREEYEIVARHAGKPPEARSIMMSNGVQIGYRSNQHFYVASAAFRVASGRSLSGRTTKTRSRVL